MPAGRDGEDARLSTLTFGALLLLTAVLAITQSPWWWLVAPGYLGLIVLSMITPARLERRLSILSAAETSQHP